MKGSSVRNLLLRETTSCRRSPRRKATTLRGRTRIHLLRKKGSKNKQTEANR
jgi:hypothetical protein